MVLLRPEGTINLASSLKPVTDEHVFYDKFSCDKFYLLVCTRNFDNFFYDKYTCSKASILTSVLVTVKIVKVQICLSTKKTCQSNLSTCMQLVNNLLL